MTLPPVCSSDFSPTEPSSHQSSTDRPNKSRKARGEGKKLNLDALEGEDIEDGEEGDAKRKEASHFICNDHLLMAFVKGELEEEQLDEDYDVDDEEFGDDDYVNNYFDGGEGEGDDDYGGDEDGGGGK